MNIKSFLTASAVVLIAIVGSQADAVTFTLDYTFDDPTPTPDPLGDQFGSSVAIDGNHVLIGARGDRSLGIRIGQAHLFDAELAPVLTGHPA